MKEVYRLPRKSRSYLAFFFNVIVILSFVAPSTAKAALAMDAPQLLYPENGATTTSITDRPLGVPSFSWTAVSGATKYRLQVASGSGFNAPITLDILTNNTSYTPSSIGHLFADNIWYWRVRVENPSVSAWSDPRSFTKTWATAANQPVLFTPADGATLAFFNDPAQNPTVFSWGRVMGAARYRFQISTASDFVSIVLSVDTLATTFQPYDRYANGIYYWRVIPLDSANPSHLGTVSGVRSFTIAYGSAVMNLVPVQRTPPNYINGDPNYSPLTFTPTFHWEAVKGAEHYRLEYTTEETGVCNFSTPTSVETRQTFYTPTDTFPNDKTYCWHVRVESGSAVGDWSPVWRFFKRWYLQPVLLTPTNSYKMGLYPLYSWTPVPGASHYKIDISETVDFSTIFETATTANTTYTPQSVYYGTKYYYWRVTPFDGGGEYGKPNDPQFEFQSIYTSTAPILIYPLYYYQPNNYGAANAMNPVEDRSVPYPIFIWHRVMVPSPLGGIAAPAYRIQVDDAPYYFTDPVWQYDTENTSASPTPIANFSPVDGEVYRWRVCPLNKSLNDPTRTCQKNPIGEEWWSQIWQVRFDARPSSGLVLPPTNGNAPELLRPAHGQESVEATPLLEWKPWQDATQYQVEISRDPGFLIPPEVSEIVNIPAYSPTHSIAQRSLGRTDYGTFYWRVRGFVGGAWSDAWSDISRFQIAAQSNWSFNPTTGGADSRFLIATDPITGEVDSAYDLTNLYAHQSDTKWYFGFNANILPTPDMTYVLYFDLDHVDSSGAPIPPPYRNTLVTTTPAHQPEYAIYIDKFGGVIDAAHTWVFAWDQVHSTWDYGTQLSMIAGANISVSSSYVELQLPYTTIGMSIETGSASVMAFSVNTSGVVQDSVPVDPQVPGPGTIQLSRFTSVSDHVNLIYPPNIGSVDPAGFPSILPFYWDWPVGSNPTGDNALTPFAGASLDIALDPKFTNHVTGSSSTSNNSYFGENGYTFLKDLIGDNIYYWRVRSRYLATGFPAALGAWSGGISFRRLGFTAKNLTTNPGSAVVWATPTFSWDMVEGADTYLLQVSTDPNFNTTAINQPTPLNSFTPTSTLAQGTYFWRVQVRRYGNIINAWSEVKTFTLALPSPTGLTPSGGDGNVNYAPTLCWDPVIKNNENPPHEPILTAWKYRVQVSRDNFSTIYDTVDTINNCWTPTKGYHDGSYSWHVAMIDGNARPGPYSGAATFTKQYPITTLISPIGDPVPSTPTFIWTPVDGAANYIIEVSKFPTFSPTYENPVTTFNTQYTSTKVYDKDVIYYWRVAIVDADGRQGPFTDATIVVGPKYHIYLPFVKK